MVVGVGRKDEGGGGRIRVGGARVRGEGGMGGGRDRRCDIGVRARVSPSPI